MALEWIRLTEKGDVAVDPGPSAEEGVSGQVAPKLSTRGRKGEGRPKSGVREATRKLGIEHREVRRAVKIAAISPEAQQAAEKAGLDKNQSALLKVAAAPIGEQVTVVERIVIEKAERAEARAAPEPEPEPASDLSAEFADYVIAHVAEDDIPGLLAFMGRMTAEEMVGALRRVVVG